ncbi:hypothetical protein MMC06_004213, partial [Schaereria dolodes]|nr:hypothetical protein [Schaereria dolodes]
MSTQFISLAAPPGPSVLTFNRRSTSSPPPESIPLPFQEAMSIRDTVFVDEQQGCFERELDADDPRSWHWVVYASISGPKPDVSPNVEEDGGGSELTGRKKSKGGRLAVGTIRLVPPPHPPHPEPHSEHMIDNAEGLEEPNAGVVSPEKFDRATSMHDGIEPYIKLGRLATLK